MDGKHIGQSGLFDLFEGVLGKWFAGEVNSCVGYDYIEVVDTFRSKILNGLTQRLS